MISPEVERIIANFTGIAARLLALSNAANEEEQRINDQTQDILHYIEIISDISGDTKDFIISKLHDIRKERRIAKQEAEVLNEFLKWFTANKACVNNLTSTLGKIRKIIKEQQNFNFYRFRTDVIEEKDSYLVVGELPGQISFEELLKDLIAEK